MSRSAARSQTADPHATNQCFITASGSRAPCTSIAAAQAKSWMTDAVRQATGDCAAVVTPCLSVIGHDRDRDTLPSARERELDDLAALVATAADAPRCTGIPRAPDWRRVRSPRACRCLTRSARLVEVRAFRDAQQRLHSRLREHRVLTRGRVGSGVLDRRQQTAAASAHFPTDSWTRRVPAP